MLSVRTGATREAPVVSLVDAVIHKAIVHGASDIHFEPTDVGLRVRYRIDGVLYDQKSISAVLMSQVLSRIKVLARIDITEKRTPQDGKFSVQDKNRFIDLRVSTFPSLHGEKIVVRILDRSQTTIDLNQLGLSGAILKQFKELLRSSSGFFLVSGPTGSGKTTTLYSALSHINSTEIHIITLEDPVEYNVAGITQGQINPECGFTFEKGIRAILRQDPDVVMIGEMRDKQTAQVAIEAALTGHIVFSTVHTSDAPSVIVRLMDMGIEPFLINAAISGVLAQRLARKICKSCCVSYAPDDKEKQMLDRLGVEITTLHKGVGCSNCLQLGYKGRIGIFELLPMSNALRMLVVNRAMLDDIYAQAHEDGMTTLVQDGLEKVKQGVITLQEFARSVL